MPELIRRPASSWSSGSLVLLTQFGDLRKPESIGSTPQERWRQLQLELKSQALLLPGVLIRDADLVNHADLQDMLVRDVDGIRGAIDDGTIVLGIRGGAECLTAVNDGAERRRAFPERYDDDARARIAEIDRVLQASRVCLAEGPDEGRSDRFGCNLGRLLASGRLREAEARLLDAALTSCKEHQRGTSLRFGELYDYLVRREHCDPYGDLVQWCRAAHISVFPAESSLAPSTVDGDLSPEMVAFMLDRKALTPHDPERWAGLYPRRILSAGRLRSMSFGTITALRSAGRDVHYFDAAAAVQAAFGTPGFEVAYERYLGCLASYLERLSTDFSIEMVDWQKVLLERAVMSERQGDKKLRWAAKLLARSIPVALDIAGRVQEARPILHTVGLGLSSALDWILDSPTREDRSPLARLLRGTTVTPTG
jgi:hypothetical protein